MSAVVASEFLLQAFAVVDRSDMLLLFRNLNAETKTDTEVQSMLEGCLDSFEEQMASQLKSQGAPFHGNVGLLQRADGFLVFGRELPNGLRLLLMVQAMFGRQPSESQLDRAYQRLIRTCLNELSNPFYERESPFVHASLHTLPEHNCFQ